MIDETTVWELPVIRDLAKHPPKSIIRFTKRPGTVEHSVIDLISRYTGMSYNQTMCWIIKQFMKAEKDTLAKLVLIDASERKSWRLKNGFDTDKKG